MNNIYSFADFQRIVIETLPRFSNGSWSDSYPQYEGQDNYMYTVQLDFDAIIFDALGRWQYLCNGSMVRNEDLTRDTLEEAIVVAQETEDSWYRNN